MFPFLSHLGIGIYSKKGLIGEDVSMIYRGEGDTEGSRVGIILVFRRDSFDRIEKKFKVIFDSDLFE